MAPPARTADFVLGELQATVVRTPRAVSVLCQRGTKVLGSILLPQNGTRSEIRASLETKGGLDESEISALLDWISPPTPSLE